MQRFDVHLCRLPIEYRNMKLLLFTSFIFRFYFLILLSINLLNSSFSVLYLSFFFCLRSYSLSSVYCYHWMFPANRFSNWRSLFSLPFVPQELEFLVEFYVKLVNALSGLITACFLFESSFINFKFILWTLSIKLVNVGYIFIDAVFCY